MKFLNPEIFSKLLGFILWTCCLTTFPVIWASITVLLGAFQLGKCERISRSVSKLFKARNKRTQEQNL